MGIGGVFRIDRHTDTRPRPQLGLFPHNGFRNLSTHLVGYPIGVLSRDYLLEDDHKFVTAETTYCVTRAHGLAQRIGNMHKHSITRFVPVGVVDRLEAVEIDE